jgi:serine/threonine protein phosphatase 1
MDIDTGEFWQSEPLHQLYFEEKGRNYSQRTIFAAY